MRRIGFQDPGALGVAVMFSEREDGSIEITLEADAHELRGFFFDINDASLLDDLSLTGDDVTQTQFGDVIDLGRGNNMRGRDGPFNAGLSLGGPGDDGLFTTSFTLSTYSGAPLSLDLLANVRIGLRMTVDDESDIDPKVSFVAPAAPDAVDDNGLQAVEDGTHVFDVLANDTDADGDPLTIVAVTDPQYGNARIEGGAIVYVPDPDFGGGFDSFEYEISDGTGGFDTAAGSVFVEAVPDAPDVVAAALPGDRVNQVVLSIESGLTDTDGSESLVLSIDPASLPAGATLSRWVIEDPDAVEQVVLSLPEGADTAFDLVIRAVSTEASNGATAASETSLRIEADAEAFSDSILFEATDRSMWGAGPGFTEDTVLTLPGIQDMDGGDYWLYSIIVRPLWLNSFGGGTVDASLPYDVSVGSYYNRTTDQLQIDPSVLLAPGGGFQTTGPYHTSSIVLDFDVELFAVIVLDSTHIGTIDEEFDGTVPLWSVDSRTTPIDQIGNEDDAFSARYNFPALDVTGTSAGNGEFGGSGASTNVFTLNLDADQAIADLFFGGVNPLVWNGFVFPFIVRIELIDLDLFAGLNFLQDFHLAVGDVSAEIVFETGDTQAFDLAAPTLFDQASQYDANGDGRIGFDLAFYMAGAMFTNDTDLNLNTGYDLDILVGRWKAGPASGAIGPVFNAGSTSDVEQVDVFDTTFELAFESDQSSFLV